MKSPTLEQLQAVWRRILADPQAKEALGTLKRDGFAIDQLMPHDLKYPAGQTILPRFPFFRIVLYGDSCTAERLGANTFH